MGELVGRVRSLAFALGGPGLALVAFLDSTFLPLPGITDLLLVVTVTRRPAAMLLSVVLTVAGSVAGALVMHAIGRKGGEALVRARFTGERIERAMAALQRNGVMAVLIPSLLPPPAPFKIFLLLAGVAGISATRLAIAIAVGRSARYLALGLLAVRYGTRAMTYIREQGSIVSLVVAAVLAAGFAAYLVVAKARRGMRR
ncbi:MAG TPA: VTT domain-containing protein [Vicinamibacterales bacterium]|nr:VTT domain-containing protein [Vicinamibacterales bacterium]